MKFERLTLVRGLWNEWRTVSWFTSRSSISGVAMRDVRLLRAFFESLRGDGVRIDVEDESRLRTLFATRHDWDLTTVRVALRSMLVHDPHQQMGGYVKRCLGLTLYVKFENPAGSRIQLCFIGDQELKRKECYKAAFVTTQGVPKKYGRQRLDLELHAIDALKQYCAAHPRVNADLRGTVVPV